MAVREGTGTRCSGTRSLELTRVNAFVLVGIEGQGSDWLVAVANIPPTERTSWSHLPPETALQPSNRLDTHSQPGCDGACRTRLLWEILGSTLVQSETLPRTRNSFAPSPLTSVVIPVFGSSYVPRASWASLFAIGQCCIERRGTRKLPRSCCGCTYHLEPQSTLFTSSAGHSKRLSTFAFLDMI